MLREEISVLLEELRAFQRQLLGVSAKIDGLHRSLVSDVHHNEILDCFEVIARLLQREVKINPEETK